MTDSVTDSEHGKPIVDVLLAPVSASFGGEFNGSIDTRESIGSGRVDIVLGEHIDPVSNTRSIGRCFLDGFITNILNPKITLFYLAAFPQFVHTGIQASGSSFALVLIHVLINALWFIAVAFLLNHLVCRSVNGRFETVLRQLSGYALIALALAFVASAMQVI